MKYWYLAGLLHREDGPAVEYNNNFLTKWKGTYFRDIRLCNEDTFFSGEIKKVFLGGKFVSEEEYTLSKPKPKVKPLDNSDIDWRTLVLTL